MSLRNFPDANTSITLDFRKGKKLDPRITFERASSATEIGEGAGVVNGQFFEFQENVPRLTDKGLLIEESRTNSFAYSEDFSQTTAWDPRNSIVAFHAAEVAPDGSIGVYATQPNTSNKYQWLTVEFNPAHSNPNCVSVFAKANGYDYFFIHMSAEDAAVFNLSTGAIESTLAGNFSWIEDFGNGWYRCSVVHNTAQSGVNWGFGCRPTANDANFTGDGSSVLIWGAQWEDNKTFPTSYIPTSGSTATRAPDQAILSGAAVTSWYNIPEGTVYSDAMSPIDLTTSRLVWHFRDPGRKEHNADNGFQWYDVGTGYSTNGFTYAAGVFNKQAYAYSSVVGSSTRACLNGAFRYDKPVDPSITPSAHTTLALGSNVGTNIFLNGYISSFAYYPTRLPDDALEALTS